jgi:hypothetical protein
LSEVLDSLTNHPGCDVLRKADVDDFLARNPRALLFFTGDLVKRTEGRDVAVVVRELVTGHPGRIRVGVIDRRDEALVMARYGVVVTPAVAYMRDGEPVELVARMRDWPVFAQALDRLLGKQTAPPAGGIGGTA